MIIPATDRAPTVARCLAALDASTVSPLEVLVVEEPRAAGPAQARNAGAAQANGAVLLFVDSDVEVDPEALARIAEAFGDPGVGAVFGAYDDRPAAGNVTSLFRNLLHHCVHTGSPGVAETFWSGLGAVRAEEFHAAGGFDAARFPRPAIEDVELGLRLRGNGTRILLDPRIRGRHLKRWTLLSMIRTDFADRGLPWGRLLLERGGPLSLNAGGRHRAGALASAGLAAACAGRRPRSAAACAVLLVGLNARLFRLLQRRGGGRAVAAGLPLKMVHDLVAIAGLCAAVLLHIRARLWPSA